VGLRPSGTRHCPLTPRESHVGRRRRHRAAPIAVSGRPWLVVASTLFGNLRQIRRMCCACWVDAVLASNDVAGQLRTVPGRTVPGTPRGGSGSGCASAFACTSKPMAPARPPCRVDSVFSSPPEGCISRLDIRIEDLNTDFYRCRTLVSSEGCYAAAFRDATAERM